MHVSALTEESGHSLLTLLRTMRLCLRDNLKTETLLHSSRDPEAIRSQGFCRRLRQQCVY